MSEKQNIDLIDKVISKHPKPNGRILKILEELQELDERKYLSKDTLQTVSEKLKVPFSRIYSIVTFYSFFNLKPQGKHTITVCRGTACHTRGSKDIVDDLDSLLGSEEGENNDFTVRTVACFGQCALAPVMDIDGKIYSNVSRKELDKIIGSVEKEK